MWESKAKGILLETNDFVTLSKEGINILSLGYHNGKVFVDKNGKNKFIHALGSCEYLKTEQTNFIYFSCQYYNDR